MFTITDLNRFKQQISKQTKGARKMAEHGQRLPYWMTQHHSLDKLYFLWMTMRHYRRIGVKVITKDMIQQAIMPERKN